MGFWVSLSSILSINSFMIAMAIAAAKTQATASRATGHSEPQDGMGAHRCAERDIEGAAQL